MVIGLDKLNQMYRRCQRMAFKEKERMTFKGKEKGTCKVVLREDLERSSIETVGGFAGTVSRAVSYRAISYRAVQPPSTVTRLPTM